MPESRPKKLLIPEGFDLPEDVVRALEAHFEVVRSPAAAAAAAVEAASGDAVFAGVSAFASLARTLAGGRAEALINALGEGACLADDEGVALWANDRFRALEGRLRDRIAESCREAARGFTEHLKRNRDAPRRRKFEIQASDDATWDVVVTPVIDASAEKDGRVSQVVAVACDVTALRRTQRKIDALDRAGSELVRLEAEEVRKLKPNERLRILEEKIVRYANELLHFDHFVIYLMDEETKRLEAVISAGLPPEIKEIDLYAAAEGNGISGYVAATGRSYICYDTSRDERYIEGLELARSSVTTPLLLHDKVIGVFNAESGAVGAFTEDDRQFAEIFSRYVALAVNILDLLVAERAATGESVSGVVEGEINEPLNDLVQEAQWLRDQGGIDPTQTAPHVEQILRDVESIRRRMRDVARGPKTLLGVEEAIRTGKPDPLLMGKRVLVADDEPRIRETIRDVLQRRGANVVIAADGAGAIEELAGARAENSGAPPFELVITDIKMPDRNGYEVFAAAKSVDVDMPVILMTGFGYDPHHSIVRASQEGLQCVLFKPFQVQQLLHEVRRALMEREPAGE